MKHVPKDLNTIARLIAQAPAMYALLQEWQEPGACGCYGQGECIHCRTRAILRAVEGAC